MSLVPKPQARIEIVDSIGNASGYFIRFLTAVTDALNGTQGVAGLAVNQVALGIGQKISSGSGVPNGVVVGSPGDLYLNTAGGAGTTLYVKEVGTDTNAGWTGK